MCKCWSQWLLIAVILFFSVGTLISVSGCGVKGALTLPQIEDDESKAEESSQNSTSTP